MFQKYRLLIIFILTEIAIALFGLNNSIKQNPDLLSLLTGLFLILIPSIYYLLTRKKQTEFTFWFVFYSVFKITPYVFVMENNFFEIIFQWKIYLNVAFLLFILCKAILFFHEFRKTLKHKENLEHDDHFIISNFLKDSIQFKKLGNMIAFEVCSFYYCLLKWTNPERAENSFSGHKDNGITALYVGLMMVSVFEAVGFHMLLISRNKNLAFLLLAFHTYLLINLIGQLKAIIFRNHIILSQKIVLRYGLFDTLEIPFDSILSIRKFEGDYEKSPELLKLALLGKLEPHNIALELKSSKNINLPFGIKKKPKKIILYTDKSSDFIEQIQNQIAENDTLKNSNL